MVEPPPTQAPPTAAPLGASEASGRGTRALALAAAGFAALKLGLLLLYALDAQYVMDEFSQAYKVQIRHLLYDGFEPVKNVLYVYFYAGGRLVAEDAVPLMIAARLQTWALALAGLGLVAGAARRLGAGRLEALLAVCVLLSFSTYMERAFRVRSEPLAVTFGLVAFWLLLRHARPGAGRALAAGAALGLAFLSTQKAAYLVLGVGAALPLGVLLAERDARRALGLAAACGAGAAGVLLGYALLLGGAEAPGVLGTVFLGPLDVATKADDHYADLGAFVVQTLTRNTLAYALCGVGMAYAALRLARGRAFRDVFGLAATAVVTALVFAHNQPWPYVFLMALPFLASWSFGALRLLRSPRLGPSLQGALLLAALSLSLPRNLAYLERDNDAQEAVVAKAESLLAPGDRYGDGIGMVVSRYRAASHVGLDAMTLARIRRDARRGAFPLVDALMEDEPKLWIDTYRLRALRPIVGTVLEGSYVRVAPNLLLAGTELAPGGQRFWSPWSGRYGLYDAQGRPRRAALQVDGRRREPPVRLARGEHRLELAADAEASGGALFLLPADAELSGPLPSPRPPVPLFRDVYR